MAEKDAVLEPLRRQIVHLGGQELMLYGQTIHFSKDAGKTWDESVQVPSPEGDTDWGIHGTVLVEGDTVTLIQFTRGGQGTSVIHCSHDRARTWEPRVPVPEFNGSEGSLVRGRDGSLVATLRTAFQDEGVPYLSDHWRGITTYRSTDDGKTWSEHPPLNKYGHVHMELLVLTSGDILMTYAARIGEVDGPHLSRDRGDPQPRPRQDMGLPEPVHPGSLSHQPVHAQPDLPRARRRAYPDGLPESRLGVLPQRRPARDRSHPARDVATMTDGRRETECWSTGVLNAACAAFGQHSNTPDLRPSA